MPASSKTPRLVCWSCPTCLRTGWRSWGSPWGPGSGSYRRPRYPTHITGRTTTCTFCNTVSLVVLQFRIQLEVVPLAWIRILQEAKIPYTHNGENYNVYIL